MYHCQQSSICRAQTVEVVQVVQVVQVAVKQYVGFEGAHCWFGDRQKRTQEGHSALWINPAR